MMRPILTIGLAGVAAAFFVDQVSKSIIVANKASLTPSVSVFPGFNLTYLQNSGVSFGLLGEAPWFVLVGLALAVCVLLSVLLIRAASRFEALAYGMIIGGALGNVTDRLRYRAVTDFLDFYFGAAHWPSFNMADVFVVGGVGLLLLSPWLAARYAGTS
mgnify:CR=1 FL=1